MLPSTDTCDYGAVYVMTKQSEVGLRELASISAKPIGSRPLTDGSYRAHRGCLMIARPKPVSKRKGARSAAFAI